MGFARLFQCGGSASAREARQKKIAAHQAKMYGEARSAAAEAAENLKADVPVLEQGQSAGGKAMDTVTAAYNGVVDEDAKTNPIQSDEEDTDSPAGTADDIDNVDDNAATAAQRQPSTADVAAGLAAGVASPMSVLSEQTAPETTPPPRILEKLEDGAEQAMQDKVDDAKTEVNDATKDATSALKAAGLLCGCI